MSPKKIDPQFTSVFELFFSHPKGTTIRGFLDNATCDEVAEFDLETNDYTHLHHTVGKYFAPSEDVKTFTDIFNFCLENIVHPSDVDAYMDLMDPVEMERKMTLGPHRHFRYGRFRYKTQAGGWRWVEQILINGEENGLSDHRFRLYLFDIQHMKACELGADIVMEEESLSERDPLTGLWGQNNFFLHAEAKVKAHPEVEWCLLCADIEHFKLFDEWFGRETGDDLLVRVGKEFQRVERQYDGVCGYMGQDDFVALVPYAEERTPILYERIRQIVLSFGLSAGFMPAIGVAKAEAGMVLADVFDRATIAASQAKGDIKNRICYYLPDMHTKAEREYRIVTQFMQAMQNEEITFFLQPQVRISTKAIVGAEALVRWIKKDGTIVPPGDFVPVLEKYGFITDMDRYLWERVCRLQRRFLDEGRSLLPISINISRVDLYSIDVPAFLEELVAKYDLPHSAIKAEITESSYAESQGVVKDAVARLRKAGFLVFMDDFGSAYSSLNMLSSVNVDVIKLDALFVQIEDNNQVKGINILESIVNMTKNLGLPIIVEGVENKVQSDFLEGLGCRYAQGYYFYKPLPIETFTQLVEDPKNVDERGFIIKANQQFRVREFLDQNIYSDSMLNNLIGAVAFYMWHGEDVDIIRFNQQFYEAVNTPDFHDRLVSIQNFLYPEDRPKIYRLLQEAKDNRLLGGRGALRFYKLDGTLTTFLMHFYFLDESESGSRFYGAAFNDTEKTDLKDALRLMGGYSNDTVVFLRKKINEKSLTVAMHGLSSIVGGTSEELEYRLNNSQFGDNVEPKTLQKAREDFALAMRDRKEFETVLPYRLDNGKTIRIKLIAHPIPDDWSNFQYILIFRKT